MKKKKEVKLYIFSMYYPVFVKKETIKKFGEELKKLMKKYQVHSVNASLEIEEK